MSVDKILGKFETRYFGAGHKNTEYSLLNEVEKKNDTVELIFMARVDQLCSWSEKNGESQQPHLSTIDGLILSILVAESYLYKHDSDICLENLYLSSFEIKAGIVPVEDLTQIPVVVETVSIQKDVQHFTMFILGMRIKIQLKSVCVSLQTEHNKEKQLHYMSNHLKNLRHDIQNIDIYNGKEMTCEVTRSAVCEQSYYGIGSKVPNGMSLIEWLILFSQMSQVIAYDFDDVERKNSDTFWMRMAKAELDYPYQYSSNGVFVSGGIDKTQIISMNDEKWRTFSMAGETVDNKVRFSGKLAHRIPKKILSGSVGHV